MQQRAMQAGKSGALVFIHVLQVLANLGLGDRPAALSALESAIRLAAQTGQRRPFLDHFSTLSPLLVHARGAAPSFVYSLSSQTGAASQKTSAAREALSPTQLRVLGLLNRGLSNQKIAEELGIGVGTVRWHLNHIFGKLQVRNRTEAVVKARETGLL
jgi:LuxR family maltose regulon positive regulatory protein